eukprot:TRINITY_DN32825_c0_g1_i1.p1 TRINITY_DN32825_c0_g1~~TRINITY_DN32825_c0_g1_i1.p1  ORF type:complete len:421 (-),score=45.42 TRINITY_DN32825_c0_g1_i1:91-1299(-)
MGETRRRCIYCGAVACLVCAWLFTPLPAWIAASIVRQIPLEEDVTLGRAAGRDLKFTAYDNYELSSLGHELLAGLSSQHPALRKYEWQFKVADEPYVNAFALPGGTIYVTRALQQMSTRDELAAVLGHEIGHVLHRHSQQRLVQQQLWSVLLGALFHGDGDGHTETFGQEVAGILLRSAGGLLALSYSRENEYEADAVAWWSCVSARLPPGGMESFFRKLDGGDKGTSWESTHPGTRDRIAALQRKGQELSSLQHRHVESAQIASHFVPNSLSLVDGNGTRGSMVGGAGFLWRWIPRELQQAALAGGLSLLVDGVDKLLTLVLDGDNETSSMTDCEDGESKISFEKVEPGYYVALGHGHCLSVADLKGLQRSRRLEVNPYTRQPFTSTQRRQIAVLLSGGRL